MGRLSQLISGPEWYGSPLVTMLCPGRMDGLLSRHVVLWDMHTRVAIYDTRWFAWAVFCGLTFPLTAPLLAFSLLFGTAGNAVVPQKMRERPAGEVGAPSRIDLFVASTAPYLCTALVYSVLAWLVGSSMVMRDLKHLEPEIAYPAVSLLTTELALFIGALVFSGAFGVLCEGRARSYVGVLLGVMLYWGIGIMIFAATGPLITSNASLGEWRYSTMIINPWLALMAARIGPLILAWLDERDRRAQSADSASEELSGSSSDCR